MPEHAAWEGDKFRSKQSGTRKRSVQNNNILLEVIFGEQIWGGKRTTKEIRLWGEPAQIVGVIHQQKLGSQILFKKNK